MAKSDFLENKILDHILGASAYAAPATVYIALFVSDPTDANNGTEVSGGSYARIAVTNNLTNWPAAVGGSKSNAAAITFVVATALWGTVGWVGLYDAASGGNLLYHGALTEPRTISSGDQFSFPIGSLIVAET